VPPKRQLSEASTTSHVLLDALHHRSVGVEIVRLSQLRLVLHEIECRFLALSIGATDLLKQQAPRILSRPAAPSGLDYRQHPVVESVELPKLLEGHDGRVLAPAEVEL